ncbi:hypothetical protein DFJ68_2900 [Terracoccus luteus]|uniref:Uncharacterized protein n=1 Tax=Terracoccus luteus TaxID=53356 RepID=A0A495Y1E7_9MICO|nr:hypothetical protein DFJ68_2900 [Terracoccus luteus]
MHATGNFVDIDPFGGILIMLQRFFICNGAGGHPRFALPLPHQRRLLVKIIMTIDDYRHNELGPLRPEDSLGRDSLLLSCYVL